MPLPLRMRNVLHGMAVALRVGRAKVEWPEVHRIVGFRVLYAECDADKTALHRLAATQYVDVDDAVGEVIAVEPHQAHTGALAELQRALSLGVHNRCRAVGNLPPRILTDSGQVEGFRWLGACRSRQTREDGN